MAYTYTIIKTTATLPEYYTPARSDKKLLLPYFTNMLGWELCHLGTLTGGTVGTYATYGEALDGLKACESTVSPTVNQYGHRLKNSMTATEYQIVEIDEDGDLSDLLDCAPYKYYQLWHETTDGEQLVAIARNMGDLYKQTLEGWGTARITDCDGLAEHCDNNDPRQTATSENFQLLDEWQTYGDTGSYNTREIANEFVDTLIDPDTWDNLFILYIDRTTGDYTIDKSPDTEEILAITKRDAYIYLGDLCEYTAAKGVDDSEDAARAIVKAYYDNDPATLKEIADAIDMGDAIYDDIQNGLVKMKEEDEARRIERFHPGHLEEYLWKISHN